MSHEQLTSGGKDSGKYKVRTRMREGTTKWKKKKQQKTHSGM
jgi:hypothetical protein